MTKNQKALLVQVAANQIATLDLLIDVAVCSGLLEKSAAKIHLALRAMGQTASAIEWVEREKA